MDATVFDHDDGAPTHGLGQIGTQDITTARPPDDHHLPFSSGQRRHPFIWVVRATAIATLIVFTGAIWSLARSRGVTTSFGWSEERRSDGWFVTSVDPAGPAGTALRSGDRIVDINGVPPLGGAGTSFQRRELSTGETYRIATVRDERASTHTLTAMRGPSELGPLAIGLLVAAIWSAVGLFIGFARPDDPVARLAFIGATGAGLGFALIRIDEGLIINPLHVLLGFHFFCRFPAGRPLHGLWRWLLAGAYGLAIACVAIRWWVTLSFLSHGPIGPATLMDAHPLWLPIRNQIAGVMFPGLLVGSVVMVARNYRLLVDPNERRRVRWIVYGTGLALTPLVIMSGLVNFGVVPPGTVRWLPEASTAGLPLIAAYAVLTHRVFDISVVVRRGVQYLLARRALQVAASLPAIALAVTVFNQRHLTVVELVTETRAYLYCLAAAGLILRFRGSIESWLDRQFFREEHDREQLVIGLLEDMRKVESLSDLSQRAADALVRALHPARLYIWYLEPDDLASISSSPSLSPPNGFPANLRWLQWLEQYGTAATLSVCDETALTPHAHRWFMQAGISMIVPMLDAGDRLVGALLLGDKRSDEPYTPSDERLLDAIAKQAAVVREHLRLRAQVSDDARVKHDVLARLDRRIPDLLKECPACGACFDGAIERCEYDQQRLTLSLPVSRTIDQKYRLDRLIGKGGMGAVYEARDLRLDRAVAVKIMLGRAFGQQSALRRFQREGRAAARLNHPNIVPVYDVGALQGEGAFLVMELVRGVTLRGELTRIGRMTPGQAAEWFGPVLDGTAAAHAHGIIHRDLKPENIIGRRHDDNTLDVKILDLGLVKFRTGEDVMASTLTQDGLVLGTPAYMSPEQLLGRDVDQRTDIFSVSVMLVEALTGERPFRGDSYADLLFATRNRYHLPGSSPRIRALDDLLQHGLAPEPSDRLASAAVLRDQAIALLREISPDELQPT